MNVNMKYLIILLFVFGFGNILAVSVNYNETIDISEMDEIENIYAYNNELFVTLKTSDSIWRYTIDYEELELKKVRSLGNDLNDVKDIWIEGNIAYVLTSSDVHKINYETRKELFKGNSDSYFPDSPYAITIENNGEYIYLVDRESKRINIMYEYDKDKYLSKGAISTFTHGLQANFNEPYDININEGKVYVLDKGAGQIYVYENYEPYTYLDILAKGKRGYISVAPNKIEVDEYFVYILENQEKSITLMDKETGEKILSVEPECGMGVESFSYANNRIYVLCSEKEDLIIYDVDKRITKTKEQVDNLYNEIINKVEISCGLYEASVYFKMNVQNKCEEFRNVTDDYTYTNNNDAYDELSGLNTLVEGYNSGVKPQLNNKIEQEINFYLNGINEKGPYTGTKNYTATRLIWDLKEILDYKNENKYNEIVNKMDSISERYNDFVDGVIYVPDSEEEEREEEEIPEIKDVELVKILNEFEYYKPLILKYPYFETKILDFENVIIEVEGNETTIENLNGLFENLKEEYLEYKENYDKVSENINETEKEFEEIKNKLFVNTQEIESELTCAKENWENNPKEAWVCLQNAQELIEQENQKSENNLFLGIFVVGFLFVGFVFVVLVGIGLYKFLKKK